MEEYTIRPILGLKTNVPQNDPTLFEGDACHCVESQNVDFTRKKRAATKATGKAQHSASANAQATKCLGLFELDGSAATDHLFWDNGKFYYLASDRTFTNVDASTPVTMGTANSALVSCIQVGDYAVFTDAARTLTPYKWKNGDANLTKLLLAGTEYKFSYLAPFQRRIFGAYSDQTNGDIEVRWTQAWTESNYFSSAATMAAANQLYKPGNDSISGIKPLGTNACIIYGEESISVIEYFANYTTPFAIKPVVDGHGAAGHHSIVDVGGIHYLFNKHYGFCAYAGGSQFPAGGKPISENIEEIVAGINPLYYNLINGVFVPNSKEIAWVVPIESSTTPNAFIFYDIMTGNWRLKRLPARIVDFWTLDTGITWNDLAALGYSTWSDFGTLLWSSFASSTPIVVHGNTDGHIYTHTTEADAGAALDGYRVEPVLALPPDGGPLKSLVCEIWFSLAAVGNYSIYVYYRSGDTVGECESASWYPLTEISADSPDNAVTYNNNANMIAKRYHQIKWGTDGATEPFSVNAITFKFVSEGSY